MGLSTIYSLYGERTLLDMNNGIQGRTQWIRVNEAQGIINLDNTLNVRMQ